MSGPSGGENQTMQGTGAAMPDGVAVRVEKVERHYQMGPSTIRAVDGVSLEVRKGEILALLGSSGSGKSTLLNLIAGLDRPTAGTIHVDGKNLTEMDGEELAKYRLESVGIIFQSFNLVPRMTVAENVELSLRLAEVERGARPGRVREALDRVGLGARVTHRPAECSGGEQQRVAIARALVNRPTLLLADEPTGNLDSKTGGEIMGLVAEIRKGMGATVVLVTHERGLAEKVADRMVFLSDGKVVEG
jgi:ABC-type lipoprotein export system ATPase subunit